MERHLSNLEKICRFCSKKIVISKGYRHPKTVLDYKETLMHLFRINSNENNEIFPKNLCNTCKKKLDIYQKTKECSSSFIPVEFVPHGDNCELCTSLSTSKGKGTFWTSIDKALLAIGYQKYMNEVSGDRTFYHIDCTERGIYSDVTVVIKPDYTWNLVIFQTEVHISDSNLVVLDIDNLQDFALKLNNMRICEGNKDFKDILERRVDIKEPFPATDSVRSSHVEASVGKTKLVKSNFDVIRHSQCQYAIFDGSKTRCLKCSDQRKNLYSLRTRSEKESDNRVSDSSKTNIRFLSRDELIQRLENAQKVKQEALKRVSKLSVKVAEMVRTESVGLSKSSNELVKKVFEKQDFTFEEGTPMSLLWQQQAKQCSGAKRSMRWHPLIIRWCLSIYHTSPAAYKQIASKRNKFLVLPHINTLKKYINFTSPTSGFNPDIIDKLIEDSKLASLEEFQKNVSISFDEMKLQAGLMYNKSSGKLVGFTEMGEVNEEISNFNSQCKEMPEEDLGRKLARYVNVFMVRGICSSLEYVFGYHASLGFTSDELFPLVWEATEVLEDIGFKVRSWVCDGASPNRKFFKINVLQNDGGDKHHTVNRLILPEKYSSFQTFHICLRQPEIT